MKRNLLALMMTAGWLLAACTPASAPATPESTPRPRPATESPPPKPTGSASGAVIVLDRSGGFAGVSEHWEIFADGLIRSGDGAEFRESPDEVEDLLADIEERGFFEMEAVYGRGSTCNDCFQYVLTVRSGGREKTVMAVEGAPDTPPELLEIFAKITFVVVGEF